ncbi:MAG: hypothetical protein H6767_04780 [Candidatus Peribacteria bacterium]|nr:MAG: hypothetical protein H6767_04780 [Candidatus Peribacteria bacterium]
MQKELTPEVLTRDFRGLKISGVMVNPSGRDDLEYIDIQNTSYLPIDLL